MLIDGNRQGVREPRVEHAEETRGPGRLRKRVAQWVLPTVAAMWMNFLIMLVALVAIVVQGYLPEGLWPSAELWGTGAVKLFSLWCLSFLPGWLYIRFLGFRAGALWAEYVLNLHRLGYDHPEYLPEPPQTSEYYSRWETGREKIDRDSEAGGQRHSDENIYRQKFDAYYGRQVAEAHTGSSDYKIKVESLFPVFLTTVVLAVAWTVVLWDTSFLTTAPNAFDVLKFAFLGAYSFIVGVLVRRFYQSDLRPSAYASAVVRIITVLLTVAALHAALFLNAPPMARQAEVAVAFMMGVFPLTALEALRRLAASTLERQLPQVAPNYPLNHLDGLNIWYEARLNEEGVEDLQNLTTMNLVDIILHTRVPVGRLVDWIDQAVLLIHLDLATSDDLEKARRQLDSKDESGAAMRVTLRRMGIRTATDLLAVFTTSRRSSDCSVLNREFVYRPCPIPEQRLWLLVEVVRYEQALVPVWNWRHGGPVDRTSPESVAGTDLAVGRHVRGDRWAVRRRTSAMSTPGNTRAQRITSFGVSLLRAWR